MIDSPTPETVLLSSLTRLMAQWSSTAVHAEFARIAGVDIDAGDVQPVYLLGLDGPKRASDLAVMLRITRPTMTKQIARLEAAGFVARADDPRDGRAVIISLTERGSRAFKALVEQGLVAVHGALDSWTDAERAQFADMTHRFTAGLTGPTAHPKEQRSEENS